MSSQALFNNLNIPETWGSSSDGDSSGGGVPFVRDSESMAAYALRDKAKYPRYAQSFCPVGSATGSTMLESNIEESAKPEYQLKPVLPRTGNPRPQDRFVSLQKWEGAVLGVEHNSFFAKLVDLTQGSPEEEAEFCLDDVSEEDRPLLKPGAIFYWNIGYHDSRTGQRRKVSEIRFRRLPAWTAREIEAARREATRLGDLIGWK